MQPPASRRPRFLSDVPDVPLAEPVQFAHAARAGAPVAAPRRLDRPRGGRGAPDGPSHEELAAAAAQQAALEAQLRVAMMERVAAAVSALRAHSERLAELCRADALEIGFMVARQILEGELSAGPDGIFALVRTAVRKAAGSRRIVVRLQPEDAAVVQEGLKGGFAADLAAASVEVVADTSLARGDVVVDTDFGRVDGRLQTRFGELRTAVDVALGEGS